MCCQALRKHLHKNKQIKTSTIQVFGQYSKDKYLGTFLEHESRVSRILAYRGMCRRQGCFARDLELQGLGYVVDRIHVSLSCTKEPHQKHASVCLSLDVDIRGQPAYGLIFENHGT